MEHENTNIDVQEGVVDPQVDGEVTADVGSEIPEDVATPQLEPEKEPQKPEENAAFAAMRRENERLARELAARDELLSGFFGDADPDPMVAAKSYMEERPVEEIKAEMAFRLEQEQKDRELADLRAFRAENTFKSDLDTIKKIYPDVKASTIDDLGSEFVKIMATGSLDAVTAYEIVRAKEEKAKVTAPPEIGKVNQSGTAAKDYYTQDEVKAMSQEEVSTNWEKIEKSRAKWK